MPLMDVATSIVVLVDYQPRLMAAIHRADDVLAQAHRLARVAATLSVPVVGTQQNPDRLGPLDEALAEHCQLRLDKMTFDACAAGLFEAIDEVAPALPAAERQQPVTRQGRPALDLMMSGCESHVCLLQTALTAAAEGHRVWVAEDACGSRRPDSHELAMRRLDRAGARLVNVEMVAFEWLRTAEHRRFKAVQALIK